MRPGTPALLCDCRRAAMAGGPAVSTLVLRAESGLVMLSVHVLRTLLGSILISETRHRRKDHFPLQQFQLFPPPDQQKRKRKMKACSGISPSAGSSYSTSLLAAEGFPLPEESNLLSTALEALHTLIFIFPRLFP